MEDLSDLLRELIDEVKGLREDIKELGGAGGYNLEDIYTQIQSFDEVAQAITGPLGHTLDDVVDRLGSVSIYGIDDLYSKLSDIETAIEGQGK